MITRCYLEITNRCNLDCVFCPKTHREKHTMSPDEFHTLTDKLAGKIRFLYFHVMGEPLLHPLLPEFIRTARQKGFFPVLTTNGTLLSRRPEILDALPHKIQISLHSHEGNDRNHPESYVTEVMAFACEAAARGCIVVLRLWNQGGQNRMNEILLQQIARYQPLPWKERADGWKLAKNLYIENDEQFEWPDLAQEAYAEKEVFCHALRNQIGILADGTVVPCCLDHAGELHLGNLFNQSLEDILNSPRAQSIYDGFTRHAAVEPFCQRCGYAIVSKRFRRQRMTI